MTRLTLLMSFVLAVALALASWAQTDTDGDTVIDALDNCTLVSNSAQIDCDHDGCGNRCDADFTQDNLVSGPDFAIIRSRFGADSTDPEYLCDVDMTSDGLIGGPDMRLFGNKFGGPPGPSGITSQCP